MKRAIQAALVLIVLFCVLIASSGFVLRALVGGSAKDRLVAALGKKIGVPVSVASADFDVGAWFRLKPAVALQEVTIGNPPGFRTKDLLQAKSISAQVALLPLLQKRIEVHSIVVDQPRIAVETNTQGLTNVEAFLKGLSSPQATGAAQPPSGSGSGATFSIDELSVNSGTLVYSGGTNLSLHEINLAVRNCALDRPCQVEESAKLFGGAVSGFSIMGQLGPFNPDSLPLDGTLKLAIAPTEIPAAIRRKQFGLMLESPGPAARAALQATIKGDVYGSFSGPAKLVLTKINIGGHHDHLLPLSGEAPATMTATSFISDAKFQLDIPNARLQLGSGEWNGSAKFRMHGPAMSGSTRGSVRNIDINEFLSCFTSASDKVYGKLSMPSSSLQFSGENADAILKSLSGTAKMTVDQGRLSVLDLPATLQRALRAQDTTDGTKGVTPFTTLSAGLSIAQSRMNVEDLALDAPGLRITGNGVIGFDQSINFALQAHVTGSIAELVNTGPFRVPSALAADVPLTVTGTVESPRVRPQIGKMAKDAVREAAHGLLQQFLKKHTQ